MKRFIISLALTLTTLFGSVATLVAPQTVFACGANEIKLSSPLTLGGKCVPNDPATGGAIFAYLRMVIQFLSSAVALVIVLMIVIGGIQYITSAGDPGAIKNAKNRIVNAITGLVLFALMFAILNFLIPGGILS